jgi:uncharacterized protein YdeI (YjbR/CyaY-like superfamily)
MTSEKLDLITGMSQNMETKNGIQIFYAKTRDEWRKWLAENYQSEKSVCLIVYHKNSGTPSVHFREAIEEAVCFGWVDSKANKRDDESFYLLFSQRNPKSSWGKVSKERAEKMISEGLMTQHGQALIDLAKKTGTWEALADAHNAVIPDDLQELFNKNKTAFKNFQAFSPSSKRIILEWILKAKKPETRQQRIMQTVALAENNVRANH